MEIMATISLSGEIRIEVVGAQGNQCLKATEGIEKALGLVQSRIEKPAMYQVVGNYSYMEAQDGY